MTLLRTSHLFPLSHHCHRFCNSQIRHTSTNAASAVEQLLRNFRSRTISQTQRLDPGQAQRLSLTLGRRHLQPGVDISHDPPPDGTPLPPGYHLVYFTPTGLEDDLGADGTDRTFNAPHPFTRRVWAGGRVAWEKGRDLRVGDLVVEKTRLLAAEPKVGRDGSEMVLVKVRKEFSVRDELAVVDDRSWIYRPAVADVGRSTRPESRPERTNAPRPSEVRDVATNGEHPKRNFRWSPVALFRFSALTFNAHMIHYNETWAHEVEGQPGLVVHGPLNLINMLDYWRDVHGEGQQLVGEVEYRAMSPIFANEPYSMHTTGIGCEKGQRRTGILVEKNGKVCMKGDISIHP